MRITSTKSGYRTPLRPVTPSGAVACSLTLSFLLAFVAACGDDPVGPGPNPLPGAPASIEIDRGQLSFGAVGSTAALTATARDAAGEPMPTAEITWTTDGTGVVELAPGGSGGATVTVSAIGNGTETIRATSGETTTTAAVTIEQVPASLRVQVPAPQLTRVGETTLIGIAVEDSNGVPLASPAAYESFSFASAAPGIVTVDAEGRVTANWLGATTITVTAGPLEEAVSIEVALEGDYGGPVVGGVVPCVGGAAAGFPCSNVDLVSYLPPPALGIPEDVAINDVWGWEDEARGRRYALVGWEGGVTFVDVTDALEPRPVGVLPAAVPSALWRDLKVYADHVFVVADLSPAHGVQVFDLTRLRDVSTFTRFTEDARYTDVSAAHNIAINEETGFAYAVGNILGGQTCGGGLHMIDISTPKAPSFAGCFADPATGFGLTGYTHDVQCVVYTGPDADYAGREICFGSNETAISIADVTDKSAPAAVSSASYPDYGYIHQGWLTEDQRYFIQNDELDESEGRSVRMLVWDVTDLDDPVLAREYEGPTGAIDHNLFVLGTRVYHSNYTFGLRVIDVSDPLNPVDLGYFDTFPLGDDPFFGGSWGNYPYFDDGRVIVSSMGEGMFIVEPSI